MSFSSDFEYAGKRKQIRRERFLAEIDQVVHWSCLLAFIEPYYSKTGGGRKTYPIGNHIAASSVAELILAERPGHEEDLYEITLLR